MQYALPLTSFNRIADVHQCLLAAFGPPPECMRFGPVSQMVLAILSARTRDEIALPAFLKLARHCGGWQTLAGEAPDAIEPILQNVTWPECKATAISRALHQIIEQRGALALDFLAEWPVEAALAWLESLYGVGSKTSAATLNLSVLRKRVLVVDTAHCRAARCLGLIPDGTSLERATRLLNRQTPDGWEAAEMEEHHMLMQHLGKTFCSRAPSSSCPFFPLCASFGPPVSQIEKEKRLEDWLKAKVSKKNRSSPSAPNPHRHAATVPAAPPEQRVRLRHESCDRHRIPASAYRRPGAVIALETPNGDAGAGQARRRPPRRRAFNRRPA